MIDITVLRAMAGAGASIESILAAVEADQKIELERQAAERAKVRTRVRRHRQKINGINNPVTVTPPPVTVTSVTSPLPPVPPSPLVTPIPPYPPTPQDAAVAATVASAPASDLERQLFQRGKEVAGKGSGGLIAKLLKAKKGDVALARAAIEVASTKQNPREYLGAIIAGGHAAVEGRRLSDQEQYYGVGNIPGWT